jgi:hypothetical protein
MSLDTATYEKLKRTINERKSDQDRAQGALDIALKQLKEEFGVDNLPDARKKLEKLQKEEQTATAAFNEELAKFKERFPDVFGES